MCKIINKENELFMSSRKRRRKQKRIASIVLIVVALVLVASIGAYLFVSNKTDEGNTSLSDIASQVTNSNSSDSSNSESTSNTPSNGDLYENFLAGTEKMSFSYYMSGDSLDIHKNSNDYDLFSKLTDKEYTLPELVDGMNKIFTDPDGFYMPQKISKMSYAYLDCGKDGNKELALSFVCPIVEEESTLTMIIKEIDGKLQLVHSYDTWSRSDTSINEYGYVTSGGSGGAALHYFESGYIDASGKYNFAYSEEDYSGIDAFAMTFDHTDFNTDIESLSLEGNIEIFTLRTKPSTMEDYMPEQYAYAVDSSTNPTIEDTYKEVMSCFTDINFISYNDMMKIESNRNTEIGATEDIIAGNQVEFKELKL